MLLPIRKRRVPGQPLAVAVIAVGRGPSWIMDRGSSAMELWLLLGQGRTDVWSAPKLDPKL